MTSSRVHIAVTSASTNPCAVDRRGKAPSSNKTSDSDRNFLKAFIEKFPRYESHYDRAKSDKQYLDPSLNLIKIYREYKSVCEDQNRKVLSEFMFRDIFNKEYNLSFKYQKYDTCKICNSIEEKKVNNDQPDLPLELRQVLEQKKNEHLGSIANTKAHFEMDYERVSNSNGDIQLFTFALQKIMETPSLTTAEAYYKRKLWTYNFCIYDEMQRKGYVYIWSESVALRGAEEIGSCLMRFLQEILPPNAKHVILYSDSCGGQNRSIKLTMLLKKFLCSSASSALQTIEQKFFITGHNFNSCDRCFGLIEKQRRMTPQIYSPVHWIELISQSKKSEPKFEVMEMTSNDFYTSKDLEDLIVNRKMFTTGDQIDWYNVRNIINRKHELFLLSIKKSFDGTEQQINLRKNNVTEQMFERAILKHLFAGGREITKKKHDDILELLNFIPAEYHGFYKDLKYDRNDMDGLDYGLANDYEDE